MKPKSYLLLPILPLLLFLTGCQSIEQRQADISLENTLNRYETAVRWGNLARLYDFLEPELAARTPLPEDLDNIRITHYEVVRGPVKTNPKQALQSASIFYVLSDRQVEHSLIDNQTWRLDESGKRWYRSNPLPIFK
jgi:hypothetical protein